MATQNQTQTPRDGWGFRRYHVGFALAFGFGAALLPPDGAVTIAGWFGGVLGAVVAGLLVAGVLVGALRVAEDWRPAHVADPALPDSRTRHVVYATVVLQLFAVGLGTTAGLSADGMLFFTVPVNVLVAAAVAIDVAALRKRGLRWETVAYGYAAAALVLGFVGGLAYWRARGRKRAEHAHPEGGRAGQGGPQPPAGGPQQGTHPPQGGQPTQRRQPRQGGQGQPPQGGQGQPQQGQGRRSGQGGRGTQPRSGRDQRGGQNQPQDRQRSRDGHERSSAGDRRAGGREAGDSADASATGDDGAADADDEPDAGEDPATREGGDDA